MRRDAYMKTNKARLSFGQTPLLFQYMVTEASAIETNQAYLSEFGLELNTAQRPVVINHLRKETLRIPQCMPYLFCPVDDSKTIAPVPSHRRIFA